MPRYNIALLPKTKSRECIRLANTFQDDAHIDYLLSDSSHPHITLVQFRVEDPLFLKTLWETVVIELQKIRFSGLSVQLQGLNWFIDKKRKGYVWLQLSPKDKAPLFDLHTKMIALLRSKNLSATNRSLTEYAPHLTLLHTNNTSYIKNPHQYAMSVEDEFYLALGESDEIGQFKKVIWQFLEV